VTITVTCYSWAPASGDHYLHVAPSSGRHSYHRSGTENRDGWGKCDFIN